MPGTTPLPPAHIRPKPRIISPISKPSFARIPHVPSFFYYKRYPTPCKSPRAKRLCSGLFRPCIPLGLGRPARLFPQNRLPLFPPSDAPHPPSPRRPSVTFPQATASHAPSSLPATSPMFCPYPPLAAFPYQPRYPPLCRFLTRLSPVFSNPRGYNRIASTSSGESSQRFPPPRFSSKPALALSHLFFSFPAFPPRRRLSSPTRPFLRPLFPLLAPACHAVFLASPLASPASSLPSLLALRVSQPSPVLLLFGKSFPYVVLRSSPSATATRTFFPHFALLPLSQPPIPPYPSSPHFPPSAFPLSPRYSHLPALHCSYPPASLRSPSGAPSPPRLPAFSRTASLR